MKKRYYKKFIYSQGYGTKKSATVELKGKSPAHQYLKEILDNAFEGNFIYFQKLCNEAMSFQGSKNKKIK